MSAHGLATILHLTWRDARRRRIVGVALICVALFLLVFAIATYFFIRAESRMPMAPRMQLVGLAITGLYVAHMLAAFIAIVLPVDTLSGEIGPGVIQTLVSKPVSRTVILLGKWLAHWILATLFAALIIGGVACISWILTGLSPPDVVLALLFIGLEMAILVTIVITGGTRFNTVTNAIVAFVMFALAFIGGWIEQIGTLVGNDAARGIGIGLSLASPNDAIGRLVAFHLQPALARDVPAYPFAVVAAPTLAMVAWAIGYVVVLLAIAARAFGRRAL